MLGKLPRFPAQNAIPALIALAFGLIGFMGAGLDWRVLAAGFLLGMVLAIAWLTRLVTYMVRRRRGSLPAEPLRRVLLRWSIEPLALLFMALCAFVPVTFLVKFAVSYPELKRYVRIAQARPPRDLGIFKEGYDEEVRNDPAGTLLDKYRSDDGGNMNIDEYKAGLVGIKETFVLRNGDVQMITDFSFMTDGGLAYCPHHQFIQMGDEGTEDTFTHIFGPWYLWRFENE